MIRAAAVLLAVIADALAVYTFAEWFAAGYDQDQRTVGWFSFVAVALVAFTMPRLVEWLALSSRTGTILFAGAAFALIYGILRATYAGDVAIWNWAWVGHFIADSDSAEGGGAHALISAFLLILLWVRQSTRSAFDVDLEAMPRVLAPAFGFVTIVAVLGAMTGRSGEVARAAAAYYTFAVLALAFSQLALSGVTLPQLHAGGITATLLAGTALVVVVGILVVGIAIEILGPIVGPPLSSATEAVLTAILTPPAIVLSWFFGLIFPDEAPPIRIQDIAQRPAQGEQPGQDKDRWGISEVSAAGVRTILALIVIAAAVGAVIYVARLRRRVIEREAEGTARVVAGSVGDDLSALWHSLRPHRRATSAPAGEGVTRLYREVLDQAGRAGHPRQPAATASEFAPVLQDAFHRPVTDEITRAFEQARYAGREPDPATLAALERRWRET